MTNRGTLNKQCILIALLILVVFMKILSIFVQNLQNKGEFN